jgi:protease-4
VHVKRTLEKLGIEPQIHKIKDYKAAAEVVTREHLSPQARENDEWILEDVWDGVMSDLAADRGLQEADFEAAMERAVFGPTEAEERGLIDGVLYWDKLTGMLKGEDDDELRTVSQARYAEEKREDFGWKGDKKIAVVHAQGNIGGRKTRVDPLLGPMMGHESVVADLRAACEDEDVAAIVFRIDSGGGESLASDLICHEVDLCAEEKPVVVSMVNVAASGGYYIAYKATKLMADPLCITGSIGSISGKFIMSKFWDKLGLTFDHVGKGPNPYFWSNLEEWDEAQWKRFTDDHWREFNEWLADVATERGMSFEEAEKLAHGRIYTGNQAVENGLIDATGDLYGAITLAKELAEIPADEEVGLIHYPRPGGLLDMIRGGEKEVAAVVDWAVYRYLHEDLAETWQAVSRKLAAEEIPVP